MTGNAADTWEKSEIRFFRPETDPSVGLSAEVTRVIRPQHGLNIDPISFLVESTREQSGNSRYFFIKFDEDHGASIVDVLQVIRPRAMESGQIYNRTMQYRQICSTCEALQRTDREDDDPRTGSWERRASSSCWSIVTPTLSCTNPEMLCSSVISELSSQLSSGIPNHLRTSTSFRAGTSVTTRELTLSGWARISPKLTELAGLNEEVPSVAL